MFQNNSNKSFHICLVIKKNLFPPFWHLNFFNILFFQHMSNCKSNLSNCSSPKPPQPTTLAIESTRELKPNIQLLSIHRPFILHDGRCFFHYCNRTMNPMFSSRRYIGIQVQLPPSLFFRTGWSNFLMNLVTWFHLEYNLSNLLFLCVLFYYM